MIHVWLHRTFIEVDTNKLTDPTVRNAKPGMPPRKFADGGGMLMSIQPSGSKWWRLACRFGGKQKLSALGTYADTGLADARLKHHAARNLLAKETLKYSAFLAAQGCAAKISGHKPLIL